MGYWESAGASLKACCKRVPLLGRLGEVPNEAKKNALYETFTTTLFATMPFWILPVLGFFIYTPRPGLDEGFQKGEGLIYASTLLGPLIFIITKRYGRISLRFPNDPRALKPLSMSFPYGGAFVTLTALTCAVAGFSFAVMQRVTPDAKGINIEGIQSLSWLLMIFATVIFFLVTAYSNMLDDMEKNKAEKIVDEQPRQENNFFDNWMESKS